MDLDGLSKVITALLGGLTGLFGAVALLLPVIIAFWRSLRKRDDDQQDEIDMLKRGQIMRGFVGAEREGLIVMDGRGKRVIADAWKEKIDPLFAEKKVLLKRLRKQLRFRLGREPDEFELAREIERTHQTWLIESVCRAIGKSDYECVAVAYAVACENGSNDHQPGSWTPGAT